MIFVTIFVLAFMAADYLVTGSVTNTWIGIALIMGGVVGLIRRLVLGVRGPLED